jgi:ketosteroid isomerase-like protein
MADGREAVLGANQAFYRAFEKRDLEAMTAVWSKGSASLCIHPGRAALKGWEAVRTSWEGIFRTLSYIEVEIEVVACEVSGDLAWVVLVEDVRQVIGGRQVQARSMATNLFERLGGSWYLVHHHGSPVVR